MDSLFALPMASFRAVPPSLPFSFPNNRHHKSPPKLLFTWLSSFHRKRQKPSSLIVAFSEARPLLKRSGSEKPGRAITARSLGRLTSKLLPTGFSRKLQRKRRRGQVKRFREQQNHFNNSLSNHFWRSAFGGLALDNCRDGQASEEGFRERGDQVPERAFQDVLHFLGVGDSGFDGPRGREERREVLRAGSRVHPEMAAIVLCPVFGRFASFHERRPRRRRRHRNLLHHSWRLASNSLCNLAKTEMIVPEPMAKPSPFSPLEIWSWTAILLISFASALLYPTLLGTSARTCLPFLLSSTVLGYMVGSGLPSGVKKVLHPIICCTMSADLAAYALGYFSKSGLDPVLGNHLTKVSSNPGAGDVLMGFLGSVILSFAFSMYKQRKLVKRHAAEIFTSVVVSTVFSLYSTAVVGRLVGLEPSLTVSILPRCITVALALSIVTLFEGANSSLTAAVVVVTGLVGANFVQATLDKQRFRELLLVLTG